MFDMLCGGIGLALCSKFNSSLLARYGNHEARRTRIPWPGSTNRFFTVDISSNKFLKIKNSSSGEDSAGEAISIETRGRRSEFYFVAFQFRY